MKKFLFFLVIINYFVLSNAELNKKNELKPLQLLDLQQKLVQNLDNFIEKLTLKVETINEGLRDYAKFHVAAENEEMLFASSAVSSFSLIRHMQSDWANWQLYLQEESGKDELEFLRNIKPRLPSRSELSSASEEVLNLMDLTNFVNRSLSLSPRDCFHLANHQINLSNYPKAEKLLRLTISSIDNPKFKDLTSTPLGLNSADVYLKLVYILLKQKKNHEAFEISEDALKRQPNNARLLKVQEHISNQLLFDSVFQKLN